jgi:hypothetical protein
MWTGAADAGVLPQGSGGGRIVIVIFTALSGAGVVFLLYVLYHFRKEDQCTRDAAVRARRSVVVEEINPEVAPMNGGPGLKLGDNDKYFVIRLETPDGIPGGRQFAGLPSPKPAHAQEEGPPADEEPETQEEG